MKNEEGVFKVLFVCTGNGYRSPICEALLKKLRPDLEVDSAGTRITSKITKEAREYLKSEDVLQYLKKAPESIDYKQLEQYNVIIAMEHRHARGKPVPTHLRLEMVSVDCFSSILSKLVILVPPPFWGQIPPDPQLSKRIGLFLK